MILPIVYFCPASLSPSLQAGVDADKADEIDVEPLAVLAVQGACRPRQAQHPNVSRDRQGADGPADRQDQAAQRRVRQTSFYSIIALAVYYYYIFGPFSHVFSRFFSPTTPHAPCDVVCFAPLLIKC